MKNKIIDAICFAGIILMCLPIVICTLYTYPVQDDFYNTWKVCSQMGEGYSAFTAALSLAINGWSTYSGYYFSLFLTYFSDAIVKCDIFTIRVCQFIMAISFFVSVYIFIRTVILKVFKCRKEYLLPIIFLFFLCINGTYYFVEHEDFLWFCASVIYLIPMICMLLGCVCMVYALETDKKIYMLMSSVLGFLTGGSVLNIAAFGCIICVMAAYWGIVRKNKIKESILLSLPMILGGIINVVAPGNFMRKGGTIGKRELLETAIGTAKYTADRIKMFATDYPMFLATIIILVIILLSWKPQNYKYKFYVPIIFTAVMFIAVGIVIYPVALGYGMDIYWMMERSNFISDFAIFLYIFFVAFYWRGWLAVKFPEFSINFTDDRVKYIVMTSILIIGFVFGVRNYKIASLRIYRELYNGEIARYADWNISVIKAFDAETEGKGSDDVVEIHTNVIEDTTCMICSKYYYGYYDPENEFANGSMAMFYGVKAIYIYNDEVEE